MKRVILVSVAILFLAGVGGVVWVAAGFPPVRLVLKYGPTPGCEPTGRRVTYEGVEFVEIGPGCFRMGSTEGAGGDALGRVCSLFGLPWGKRPSATDEMPVRWVELPRGFFIARTEVTNEQYERFDSEHERSGSSPGDGTPVVDVSWEDAQRYCAWLSRRSGREIRLPSEAEWECACRAGSAAEYTYGDGEEGLGEYAWFAGNSGNGAREVGSRRPNAWGLFDLHGNVWEWCEDQWHDSYDGAPSDGSPWVDGGSSLRVFRGGCWVSIARLCRSANRFRYDPGYRYSYLGFRPAFLPSDP